MEEEQIKNLRNQDIPIKEEEYYSQRKKEWQETVKDQETIYTDKTYSRSEKEALEEELTRLALIITENKFKMCNMLTQMQETEDDIRLVLTLMRIDLKKSNDEYEPQEDVLRWNVIEQRIRTSLIKLERCHEVQELRARCELTLEQGKEQAEEKTEQEFLENSAEVITRMQSGQAEKKKERPLLKCYYCHEEGHFQRDCAKGGNNEKWTRMPRFKRHKQNINDMSVGTSMAWPCDESSGEDKEKKQNVIMEQTRKENEQINYNSLGN